MKRKFYLQPKMIFIYFRMYTNSGVEPYSWGVLAQGPGNNKLSIGGRKSFGILDIR